MRSCERFATEMRDAASTRRPRRRGLSAFVRDCNTPPSCSREQESGAKAAMVGRSPRDRRAKVESRESKVEFGWLGVLELLGQLGRLGLSTFDFRLRLLFHLFHPFHLFNPTTKGKNDMKKLMIGIIPNRQIIASRTAWPRTPCRRRRRRCSTARRRFRLFLRRDAPCPPRP